MEYKEIRITIKNNEEVLAQLQNLPIVFPQGKVKYIGRVRETIEVLADLVGDEVGVNCEICKKPTHRNPHREEMALLGKYLYELLFLDKIDSLFRDTYTEVKAKAIRGEEGPKLRVVLQFMPEADELASLPWEYLFLTEEGGGNFFTALGSLILSRHVKLNIPPEAFNISGPKLRILGVVSSPTKAPWDTVIKADEVIEAIKKLRDEEFPNYIEIEPILKNPTKETFEKALEKRPHILHFFGHGRYGPKGGELVFVGEDGGGNPISDKTFADFFEVIKPRLVFLQACEGSKTESFQAFAGVALQLVTKNIPAVVGMQYSIPNKAARIFATTFYRSLAKQLPIDVAVQDGRRQLGLFLEKQGENFSTREFGCPVLFLQSQNYQTEQRMIFSEKKDTVIIPGKEDIVVTPKILNCPFPDCRKAVNPDSKKCPECGRLIAFCPDGHVYQKLKGFCDKCDYVEAKVSSKTPGSLLTVIPGGFGESASASSTTESPTQAAPASPAPQSSEMTPPTKKQEEK